MSTNSMNKLCEAVLSNFSNYTLHREIILQHECWHDEILVWAHKYIDIFNRTIQELNMLSPKLQIPYFIIDVKRAGDKSVTSKNVCAIMRQRSTKKYSHKSRYTCFSLPKNLNTKSIIDLYFCSEYRLITCSSNFCFRALGNKNALINVLSDMLLDEAMLYAYLGNRSFSFEELEYVNNCKKTFILNGKFTSSYRIDKEDFDNIFSLSFATFCRKKDSLDMDRYTKLWDQFIICLFQKALPMPISVANQLKFHKLFEQLPEDIEEKILDKPSGAYLLLRVHKKPTSDNRKTIEAIFGRDASIGRIKVVSISEYYKKDYQVLIQNLEVSAYKIIVSNSRN